jgi:hypothetical protein
VTDQEQPADKPPADEPKLGDEQQIEDERRYTTREAGKLLGLQRQTIISHIKRENLVAERQIETRGPVYYITGAEIKRFRRERRAPGSPGRSPSQGSRPTIMDNSTSHLLHTSIDDTNVRPDSEQA